MPAASALSSRRPSPAQRMPAYALYGEPAVEPTALAGVDAVHAESIAARSRLHGWEIRPHRHAQLCQLLVVRRGSFQALLDGQTHALRGPALVAVPALAAHGFVFADEVDGWVITVPDAQWQRLAARDAALARLLAAPRAAGLAPRIGSDGAPRGAHVAAVMAAAQALHDEHQAPHQPCRDAALEAALLRLAVAAVRAWPVAEALPPSATPPRALAHVQGLRALVDARFREQPGLAVLAAELGITPTQLNRACQQVLGHAASQVLHRRLLLEAQRSLAYTAMTVAEIALDLGFCEAGYFTRFFRQRMGCTPGQWRARAAAAQAAGAQARPVAAAKAAEPALKPLRGGTGRSRSA